MQYTDTPCPLRKIKAHVYGYSQEERLSLLFRYYAVKCPILHRRNKAKLRFFFSMSVRASTIHGKDRQFSWKGALLFGNFCKYLQTHLLFLCGLRAMRPLATVNSADMEKACNHSFYLPSS